MTKRCVCFWLQFVVETLVWCSPCVGQCPRLSPLGWMWRWCRVDVWPYHTHLWCVFAWACVCISVLETLFLVTQKLCLHFHFPSSAGPSANRGWQLLSTRQAVPLPSLCSLCSHAPPVWSSDPLRQMPGPLCCCWRICVRGQPWALSLTFPTLWSQCHCAVSSPQPRSTSSFLLHTLLLGNPPLSTHRLEILIFLWSLGRLFWIVMVCCLWCGCLHAINSEFSSSYCSPSHVHELKEVKVYHDKPSCDEQSLSPDVSVAPSPPSSCFSVVHISSTPPLIPVICLLCHASLMCLTTSVSVWPATVFAFSSAKYKYNGYVTSRKCFSVLLCSSLSYSRLLCVMCS